MYRKVLFAHDGSEIRGEHALAELAALGRAGAALVLCHVVQPAESLDAPDTMDETVPSPSVASNEHLDLLQKRLEAEGVSDVETLILDGRPAESIAAAARDLECDLIVVVTAARRGIARFLAGSVAGEILALADSPVLMLRDPEA